MALRLCVCAGGHSTMQLATCGRDVAVRAAGSCALRLAHIIMCVVEQSKAGLRGMCV